MEFAGLAALLGVPIAVLGLILRLATDHSNLRRLERVTQLLKAVEDGIARDDLLETQQLLARRIWEVEKAEPPWSFYAVSLVCLGLSIGLLAAFVGATPPNSKLLPYVFGGGSRHFVAYLLATGVLAFATLGIVTSVAGIYFTVQSFRRSCRAKKARHERILERHATRLKEKRTRVKRRQS